MISGIFLAVTLFSLTVLGWELLAGGHHGGHPAADTSDNDLAPAPKADRSLTVRVAGTLRSVAYFGLGFGPMGLAGGFVGASLVESFLWALGVGSAAVVALRVFSRLQTKETDSSVSDAELLWETAVVVVPLEPGQMGKVRFDRKGSLVERYAVASDPSRALPVGIQVRIIELNADTVTVEEIDG